MKTIVSTTQPEFTDLGDEWYNPDENALYKLLAIDGKTVTWVELADPRIYESLIEDAENTITALDETTLQTITSGQESSKPSSDSIGKLRFNTTTNNLETYGINWVGINPTFVEATGGIIETADGYRTHIFTSTSNLVVSALSTDTSLNQVEYLVVAGGGGGGGSNEAGGGGGAGGFRTGTISLIGLGNVLAQVGAGGGFNANGNPSVLGNIGITSEVIESAGGGRGGGQRVSAASTAVNRAAAGSPGGSGGGSGAWPGPASMSGSQEMVGLGNIPPTPVPQGYPGNNVQHSGPGQSPIYPVAWTPVWGGAGGGGGAGGAGIPAEIWGPTAQSRPLAPSLSGSDYIAPAMPSQTQPHALGSQGGTGRVSHLSPPQYGTPGPRPGRWFAGGGDGGGVLIARNTLGPFGGGGGRSGRYPFLPSAPVPALVNVNANVNTGGGGAGGGSAFGAPTPSFPGSPTSFHPGSSGGSGIVIIRYKYNYPKVIK